MNEQVDDIQIEAPTYSGELDPIDPGAYIGTLIGFKVEEKPAWKIEQQQKTHPDKEVDLQQWAFKFRIDEGDYQGRELVTWENRSWHERSNAAKIVCALLDIDKLQPDMGMSTRQLIGKRAQLWITEKNGRNYIDKVVPVPRRKAQRPAQAPQQRQVVPEPQWAGAPARTPRDGGDLDWE